MASSYFVTFGNDRLTFPGATGSVAWEDTNPVRTLTLSAGANGSISADTLTGYDGDVVTLSTTPSAHHHFNAYSITGATLTGNQFAFSGSDVTAEASFDVDRYKIIFGENNGYSAGLTATYNGDTIYSRALGSAQATVTGIPYGSTINFASRSAPFHTYTISTVSAISASSVQSTNWDIDGASATATGYLTADGAIRLGNGALKYFRVTGGYNMPNSNGATALYYAKPTATATGAYRYVRSVMTSQVNSYCSGGNGNASSNAAGFRGISASGFYFSGWCDTKGEHLGGKDTYIATTGANSLQVNGTNFGSRNVSNTVSLYNNNVGSNKNKPTLMSWGSTNSTAGWIRAYKRATVSYSNGYVRVANQLRQGWWSASGVSR